MSALLTHDPGVLIDPWLAVKGEWVFEGEAQAKDLPRLVQALGEVDGGADWPVRFALRFGRDRDGRAVVLGQVALSLRLTCQRCLGDLSVAVATPLALGLAQDHAQADTLPEHLDPLLWSSEGVRPLDLVEDELLLALPQVPRHEPGDCQVVIAPVEAPVSPPERDNPFAVLARLKETDAGKTVDQG